MTYRIVRDGLMFRAVCDETGFRSPLLTSASQAGMLIQRKAGANAHRLACDRFAMESADEFRLYAFAKAVSAISH